MNNTEDQIKDLMLQGLGRRRIAKQLGLRESKVRKIISRLIEEDPSSVALGGRPKKVRIKPAKVIEEKPAASFIVKKSNTRERVLVISDVHVPFECKDSVNIFLAYAEDNPPQTLVLLGDIADLYSVSRYDKCMRGKDDFPEEVEKVKTFLTRIRRRFPLTRIIWQNGNHEARIFAYLQRNAGQLIGLASLTIPVLFDLDVLNIEYNDANTPIVIGELILTHGSLARKGAGSTARGMRDKYGNHSILCGHVHKASVAAVRTFEGHDLLIENPCLAKLDVDYAKSPDFINGFTELVVSEDGKMCAHTHMIRNKKLICPNGDIYSI